MHQYHASDIIPLLDLTSLQDDDSAASIEQFCRRAHNRLGSVAAVCVYPAFIQAAQAGLDSIGHSDIAIATVVNFPDGDSDIDNVVHATTQALNDGATEIDVVIPYRHIINGDNAHPQALLKAVSDSAHRQNALVKVILETGALTPAQISQAAAIAIDSGADFLKTSTGKIATGATPAAVSNMLAAIQAAAAQDRVGIKISGGVRSFDDACTYLDLIQQHMGAAWLTPAHVRIGASSLLDALLND